MDTSQQWANNLYYEAIRFYEIPEEDWVVPMLIVAGEVLIGGEEIPRRFPAIIEEGLAGDGVDVPNFPALVTFLREQNALDPRYPDRLITRRAQGPETEASPPAGDSVTVGDSVPSETPVVVEEPPAAADTVEEESSPETEALSVEDPTAGDPPEGQGGDSAAAVPLDEPTQGPVGSMDLTQAARGLDSMTMWDRFNLDPTGSSIAVLVLLGMIISMVLRGFPPRVRGGEWPVWVIPALVVIGVVVASYLSYTEISHAQAACGPVGDCNTVNQSKYATLFGVLPVGVLGLMAYGLILALWLLRGMGSPRGLKIASLGLWGVALLGTLFSVYLTFLEPFVIGATCAWCLSSAVIMTLLLWVSAPLAAKVWPGSE
jgi:uncharacterized membrane protein